MLLAIDVGNTNVTIGVFDGDRLVHSWRLAALRERTADEMGIFVKGLFEQSDVELSTVTGIALASVVPPLTRPMEEMADRYFKLKPLTVDATNAGMPVHYSPVGDVGADRIVNAVAAWEQFGRAGAVPLIVVDFGTGTTLDVISRRGEYLGGVRKAAAVGGKATVGAMQSGLFCGYVEVVGGLVRRTREEVEGGESAVVIATGGLADVISGESRSIQHVAPNLTLDGLRLIWDRHQTPR